MATTITLLNEKGGVGKTTLTTTLATAMALDGARVLVIDTDAQGHSSYLLGNDKEPCLYDMLVRNAPLQNIIRRVDQSVYVPEGFTTRGQLALIPSNVETRNIANSMTDGFALAKRIKAMDSVFDYIIIDTSPSPSLLHTSIYFATDYVVYPVAPEALALDGLFSSITRLEEVNVFIQERQIRASAIVPLGIVPTVTELSTLEHAENMKVLKEHFGSLLFSPITKRTIWREASAARKSVFAYAGMDSIEAKVGFRFYREVASRIRKGA